MADVTMTIGGEAVAGGRAVGVVNPALGRVFAEAPECAPAQLEDAIESAAQAFGTWRDDAGRRRTALMACAAALQDRLGEVAPVLTQEQGKPLGKAVEELTTAITWLQYTASLEIPVDVIADDHRRRIEIRRRPLGVVAAITAWDYPVLLAVWKIAPALLAGNTVVLKPSPFTPLSTLMLGAILRPVLPPGVVNVVSGGDEIGASMSVHPRIRKLSFTGSVATGKKVGVAAVADLKRLTLELGGNDAAIVLPDADPRLVGQKIFWGAFENCGQVGSAVKRVYVPDALYEAVVTELVGVARSVKVGNGLAANTQMGPVNNQPQLQRVGGLVEDARARGARIAAGGEPIGGDGYFFRPTIVADIDDGTPLVDEEQFGPALPVVRYRDVDDAIARANAPRFGLGGSVWGRDVARAVEVAGRLDCGTVWVNQHLVIHPHAPFGGVKWSGFGVENGPWGLAGYTELQTVSVWKK